MNDHTRLSIVIPNFNGKELLAIHLASVINAADIYRGGVEVIVVDDGSTDGSVDFLKEAFPSVDTLALPKNVGFAKACHLGILKAKGEIVILLNNDVTVEGDLVACLNGLFLDKDLFGVAFDMLSGDTEDAYSNRILPIWEKGILTFDQNGKSKGPGPSFYACGGGMAFDKKKYMALGGFDLLFKPIYWEDSDLSYRAWKRGWRTIFHEPCRVRHYPTSTMSKLATLKKREEMMQKNRFVFLWKNLTDKGMLLNHLLWLPRHLVSAIRRRDWVFVTAFIKALASVPAVLRAREKEKGFIVRGDKEIFALFRA